MKFYNIGCPDRFLQRVAQCRGNVYYLDKSGTRRDMKKLAEDLLATGGAFSLSELSGLDIRMESEADCIHMLNFAMQANVS